MKMKRSRSRAGETVSNVLLHAHAAQGTVVEVTVVTTNSLKPLANVQVAAGQSLAWTGANGVARLRVPAGRAEVCATKAGWFPASSKVARGRSHQ